MKITMMVAMAALVALNAQAKQGVEVAAGALETNPPIAIHIYDYADVDPQTLIEAEKITSSIEAEKITSSIFRKAGVESRWPDSGPTTQGNPWNNASPQPAKLADIQLAIHPGSMADRLGLPDEVMGLAPGSEPGRRLAYVFYNRVESLAGRQMRRRVHGNICGSASTAQILGHAMAHEIGHLLLNLQTHSDTGIMRGDWDGRMLQDACYGYLLFTRQQAAVIRAEAHRRLIELGASGWKREAAAMTDHVMIALK
jgi:hypothetical protein